MSDEAPEQDSKTEDPSQKRLEEAHKRGDVAKSQEVTSWFMLAGATLVFAMLAPATSATLMSSMASVMANADQFEIGGPAFGAFWGALSSSILLVSLIPLVVLAACAIAGNMVQHPLILSASSLKPKFEKISPIAGFKRLFSAEALVNFLKGLVKLCVVSGIMVAVLWPEIDRLDTLMTSDPLIILAAFSDIGLKIFGSTLAAVTVIALADFTYQRQKWWKRQMMTLQEVKDEYKQSEGDPKVKGRIRQLRQERSRRRMMAAVPDATVVITNPTHFAVALKYDRSMRAPLCVAKGADAVALRIREVAKANDVPIIENPPLARALFASVEIDDTIPTEHFKAVAELIGFVLRLKSKPSWRGR